MAESSLRVLALVTDAFGGEGGIAQYNRDFLSALAACERVRDVIVLPRAALRRWKRYLPACGSFLPCKAGSHTRSPRSGPREHTDLLMSSFAATCSWHRWRPSSPGSCAARLWVQVHGTDAWQELSRLS